MADINKIFRYLENWKTGITHLHQCKTLLVCPTNMRKQIDALIIREIKFAKAKKEASIILKVNSLSDVHFINRLNDLSFNS